MAEMWRQARRSLSRVLQYKKGVCGWLCWHRALILTTVAPALMGREVLRERLLWGIASRRQRGRGHGVGSGSFVLNAPQFLFHYQVQIRDKSGWAVSPTNGAGLRAHAAVPRKSRCWSNGYVGFSLRQRLKILILLQFLS